ncbi:MAG: F0F1 ATP synthase subunit B [Chloroflexota bacterium]
MEALGINLTGLIAQVINFLLLLFILSAVAYKPVIKMLDERSRRIKESMENAERIKQEAARSEQEVKKRLDEARQEAQSLVNKAIQAGERLRSEEHERARKEADEIVDRARAEIHRERDAAIEQVRRQFADLAVVAAEKIIRIRLDKEAHKGLINEVLEESARLRNN